MVLATKVEEPREDTLDRIRAELVLRRNRILGASSSSIRDRLTPEEGNDPKDEADLANVSSRHWMDTIHHNKRNSELAQIDKALQKIQDGTYGTCEECGEAIPEGRLRVRPFALMCVECQEEQERSGKSLHVRSIGEEEAELEEVGDVSHEK